MAKCNTRRYYCKMYNPNEAKKSYLILLKERGFKAALQSLILVVITYFFNKYLQNYNTPVQQILLLFFFFCAYLTWKPKLIRILRKHLRGKEYMDRSD